MSVRLAGRVTIEPEALELFAGSLGATPSVAGEETGTGFSIVRIIEPHVDRVSSQSGGGQESQADGEDGQIDARTLRDLLACGFPKIWVVDAPPRVRRAQLVRQRTRETIKCTRS
jgi:hypothetical protein